MLSRMKRVCRNPIFYDFRVRDGRWEEAHLLPLDTNRVEATIRVRRVRCDGDLNRLLFQSSPKKLINVLVKTLFTTTSY
jgi:hypothetical protein